MQEMLASSREMEMVARQPQGLPHEWRRYALDFTGLKKQLATDGLGDHNYDDFKLKLNVQVSTAIRFAEQTVQTLCNQLWAILQNLLRQTISTGLRDIQEASMRVASCLRSLHTFIHCHHVALRSLETECSTMRRHDGGIFAELNKGLAVLDPALGRCMVALGDILTIIRRNEDLTATQDTKTTLWKAPPTFARSVTKYRVNMQHVMDVKLRILEYLPVLIIDKPEPQDVTIISSSFLEKSDSSFITSVYLDGPLFQSYSTRLAREEGSELFRMRWYGANGKPHANERVFVEQKIHHKKPALSEKRRFGIRGCEVHGLSSGHLEYESESKSAMLRANVGKKLLSEKMTPVLRTLYRRTAFQRSSTNAVRISLDTEVKFFDVRDATALPVDLGWAVLEVKVSGDTPEWVNDLLRSDAIQPLENFSKYLHGVASFHHRSGKLHHLPSWFTGETGATDDSSVLEIFNCNAEVNSTDDTSKIQHNHDNQTEHSMDPLLPKTDAAPKLGSTVEPKTYFANERTFIQWLTAGALLVTLASSLLLMHKRFGISLFVVAFALIFYALAIYHWRLRQFRMSSRVDYSDYWGPSVLAVLLCIALGSIVVATMATSSGWVSEAKVGLAMPPIYAERRHARGCMPVPLVINGTHANSWEMQEILNPADFATMEQRQIQVDRFDSQIRRFYEVKSIGVQWSKTVEKYCLPHFSPDCQHFLKHIVEKDQVVFKIRDPIPLKLPVVSPNHTYQSKLEVDAYCSYQRLCYELKVDGVNVSSSPWTSVDIANGVLSEAYYNTSEPLQLNVTTFRTKYKYKVQGVGGCEADVNLELRYDSEEDRASGHRPNKVELSVRLGRNATFLALRHGEGLLEYLIHDENSNAISMMYLAPCALAALVFAVVQYMRSQKRHLQPHGGKDGYEPLI
jgi:SPX domain protein involved in polyphosphate accumulation/uncharacterized membrane protein YidH (DUF202 family)